jgi:hypothetical protein
LFSGEYLPPTATAPIHPSSDTRQSDTDRDDGQRLAGLEATVASLKSEVEELKRLFSDFAGQFK